VAARPQGSGIAQFDVAYFAASTDDVATNVEFAKQLQLDFPILSDPEKKVARAYGVVHARRSVPERWTFFINKNGVIKHIDKKVNAREHGVDVVRKLKELGIPKKSSS